MHAIHHAKAANFALIKLALFAILLAALQQRQIRCFSVSPGIPVEEQ